MIIEPKSSEIPVTQGEKVIRIGLISPCGYGNLGNAAIMTAMIDNIHQRLAEVEIVGITLNPDETSRRHGISSFPLSGISLQGYYVSLKQNPPNHLNTAGKCFRIRSSLKRVSFLRDLVIKLRPYVSTLKKEASYIFEAYRYVGALDAVIICGGGALDEFWGGPWGHPWTLCRWSILSRLHGKPLLFVSVGKSSLERILSRFFVRVALRLSKFRSYRDNDSKNAVQEIINAHKDSVYPDLAFSYPLDSVFKREQRDSDDALVVGISPIAYCDPSIWPSKNAQIYIEYLRKMANLVRWLYSKNYKLFFFATDSPDVKTIDDLNSILGGENKIAEAIRALPNPLDQSVDNFLGEIYNADIIIASRLHGIILSHIINKPVLAISYDKKVKSYMGSIEQMDYLIDIDEFNYEQAIERFAKLASLRKREMENIRMTNQSFRKNLSLQYDKIITIIQGSDNN